MRSEDELSLSIVPVYPSVKRVPVAILCYLLNGVLETQNKLKALSNILPKKISSNEFRNCGNSKSQQMSIAKIIIFLRNFFYLLSTQPNVL